MVATLFGFLLDLISNKGKLWSLSQVAEFEEYYI